MQRIVIEMCVKLRKSDDQETLETIKQAYGEALEGVYCIRVVEDVIYTEQTTILILPKGRKNITVLKMPPFEYNALLLHHSLL